MHIPNIWSLWDNQTDNTIQEKSLRQAAMKRDLIQLTDRLNEYTTTLEKTNDPRLKERTMLLKKIIQDSQNRSKKYATTKTVRIVNSKRDTLFPPLLHTHLKDLFPPADTFAHL